VLRVGAGDQRVGRDLHLLRSLGDGTDLMITVRMGRVVRINNPIEDVVLQGLESSGRHRIARKNSQGLRLVERLALAAKMILQSLRRNGRRIGCGCASVFTVSAEQLRHVPTLARSQGSGRLSSGGT